MSETKQRFIKPSKLLKEAKEYLHPTLCNEYYSYVCHCVVSAKNHLILCNRYDSLSCQDSANYLHDYIDDLLQGNNTLHGWLIGQNIPNFSSNVAMCAHLDYQKKLQKTRHAWVDWMIKDLESQGL